MEYKQRVIQYKELFSGETGKAVLDDLEKQCFLRTETYDSNIHKMAFNEGRRSVILYIKRMITTEFKAEPVGEEREG